MILFLENVRQIPQKGVRPMLNLTDFEKKMIKGLFKREKPEIIRRVANSQSKFFKTKVRESQTILTK